MKLIITEEQYRILTESKGLSDEDKKELYDEIEVKGLFRTADDKGLTIMTLAKKLGFRINGFDTDGKLSNEVNTFLYDIVNQNPKYENCELSYYGMAGTITWSCDWNGSGGVLETETYATPYWDNQNSTPVELTAVKKEGEDWEYGFDFIYDSIEENPNSFENIGALRKWFNEDYKPKVYEKIKEQLKKIP